MPAILHMVGIKSPSPDATYKALTTRDGLAGWWTELIETGKGAAWPNDVRLHEHQ